MLDIISIIISYVLLYKYLAIFVITFLGALALPLPSGTMLVASVAFSTQGYLSAPLIIIVGILGNIMGDNVGYWLARRYGIRALLWLGMKKLVNSEKYQNINEEISSHPILTIYFSRFMPGVAPAVNVICGLTKLNYRRYLTFEVLGEFMEVCFFALLGYIFGANWEIWLKYSAYFWIFLLAGVVCTYLFIKYVLKSRRKIKNLDSID